MDRRAYLSKLASDYREVLGPSTDEIINQINDFSDEEVESLIVPFEKAKRRESMIKQGKADEVLIEIDEEDDMEKISAHKKTTEELAKKELKERGLEVGEIETILEQIRSA